MIKILYIDSDKIYGKKLLDFLIEKNYELKYLTTIKEAYQEYPFFEPDLIITEQKLLDGSGTLFIKKIKKSTPDIKTFILTTESTQSLLMDAIELKVDKVLLKEISFNAIDHHIKSMNFIENDNSNFSEATLLDLGEDFFYDLNSNGIIKNNDSIQLTTQENLLIEKLLQNNGSVVKFEVLQHHIGKNEPTTIDTLRTVVKKVRKKTYNKIIQNKSGLGYKIELNKDLNLKDKSKVPTEIELNASILIVKGDKQKSDLLKYNLEKFGLKCETTYTIKDSKTLLSIEKYDYVILDLNLPDGNGVDFIREIEDTKTTKLIVLSSNADVHHKEYLYFKGIIDYIVDINDVNYLALNVYITILKIEGNTKYNDILVIEKSKQICAQLQDILLPRNYKLTILNNLDNALELVKETDFSLIIIDLDFDECYEFITDVKSNIDKAIPFIVLSGVHRNYDVVRESYKRGASECLRKPLFAEEFILKVDQITENSKLIKELKEQKNFMKTYQDIVDKTTIVSKTDINGIITYVNDMFCKISGYSKEELIGKRHNIIRDPKVSNDIYEKLWKTIKEEKNIWQGVLTNKSKDGSIYTVDSNIMPIINENNNIVEFIALRREIKN